MVALFNNRYLDDDTLASVLSEMPPDYIAEILATGTLIGNESSAFISENNRDVLGVINALFEQDPQKAMEVLEQLHAQHPEDFEQLMSELNVDGITIDNIRDLNVDQIQDLRLHTLMSAASGDTVSAKEGFALLTAAIDHFAAYTGFSSNSPFSQEAEQSTITLLFLASKDPSLLEEQPYGNASLSIFTLAISLLETGRHDDAIPLIKNLLQSDGFDYASLSNLSAEYSGKLTRLAGDGDEAFKTTVTNLVTSKNPTVLEDFMAGLNSTGTQTGG